MIFSKQGVEYLIVELIPIYDFNNACVPPPDASKNFWFYFIESDKIHKIFDTTI